MELFLIYIITRLTDLKDALDSVVTLSGIFLTAIIVARLVNTFFTPVSVKERAASDEEPDLNVYIFRGVEQSTRRGIRLFAPLFVAVLVVNLFLPTTKDAVVIAGGYGLVEAVKNERVQVLFAKSAKVAGIWLDEQLNGEHKDSSKDAPAKAASEPTRASSDKGAGKEASGS